MKHVAASNLEAQLFGLSTLVQLVRRARHAATAQELAFVMVNETHALVPYRQAVLWRRDAIGGGGVVAISGGAVVERNAPITLWLNRAMAKRDSDRADTPRAVSAADLSGALARSQHGLQSMIPVPPPSRASATCYGGGAIYGC